MINYWMVSISQSKYEIFIKNKDKQIEFTKKYQKRVKRIEVDDRMIIYIKDIKKWIMSATIITPAKSIIKSRWSDDITDYIYGVNLNIDKKLDESNAIDATYIAPSLEYLKKWLPYHWELAFYESMHILSSRDFKLIESEMNRG